MKWNALFFLLIFPLGYASAQYPTNPVKATPATERYDNAKQKRQNAAANSLTDGLKWQNIGPTIMSGRVVDIEVDPKNAAHFFVAYASGGLWETKNNGTTFEPVFDNNGLTLTIGDFTIQWDKGEIWVGSGEANSSRSSYAGYGIFYSPDMGASWQYKGLGESHHIARILIHPTDPKTIYVAALGHLYSSNPERGVYVTHDGGENWEKTLFVNDNTGVVDMVQSTTNNKVLYAAAWEKSRRAWNFWEGGKGSGIYRSEDGGTTWKNVTTRENGFPVGENLGRIGLALHSDNNSETLYAMVDNQEREKKDEKKEEGINKKEFKDMSNEEFLLLPDSSLNAFLKNNGFPTEHTAASVKKLVRDGKIKPSALYNYLTDANAALFEDPVIGAEVYVTTNQGGNWKKTHEETLENVCYSYGYYFGVIRVDPNNAQRIFIAGVPILMSEDGGKTFKFIGADNVHVDHHEIWIDPSLPGHIINGNDGGVNISYDYGQNWIKCNNPAVGQFYSIAVSSGKKYDVYGGMQDNGTWKGPSTYTGNVSWHQYGDYPYDFINGGDGMQVMLDEKDNVVYTGYQFGHYTRINMTTGNKKYIHPKHKLGEAPLRWNWETPIWLSQHNHEILYMGSNRFHRSMDMGETFETLSGDLTGGGKVGDVSFGTLTVIHESPLEFGKIVVGSDDGLVHLSLDAGKTWQRIDKGLPDDLWVSQAILSGHEKNRIYVALNGYRYDNFASYIYCSEDNGKSWKRIGSSVPSEPVNVIREDMVNPNLLYVGTDNGIYYSLDRGETFAKLGVELPPVAVHDLVIQEDAEDCVIGTHGRSIYKLDIDILRKLDTLVSVARPLWVQEKIITRYSESWGSTNYRWDVDTPSVSLTFASYNDDKNTRIEILDTAGRVIQSVNVISYKGINKVEFGLVANKSYAIDSEWEEGDDSRYYLRPGKYTIKVVNGENLAESSLVILQDD